MSKRRKKHRNIQKRRQHPLRLGIAWYTSEQFARLKVVAADADSMDDTYEDWLINATTNLQKFQEEGFDIVKVPFDVDEWVAWCKKNEKPLTGASRSQFTSMKASSV